MLDITMPALVFPALSVLMLAYTNRFIALSKRVRALHSEHKKQPSKNVQQQIVILNKRMTYIRNMQITAISGFSANILSMLTIFLGVDILAKTLFITGLTLVFISLVIAIMEIYQSDKAMSLLLEDDLTD